MRRRFFVATVPLVMLLIAAVVIPAAIFLAQRHTSALLNDRLLDAARFVSLIESAEGEDDERLAAELDNYAELYSSRIWLIGRDSEEIHVAGDDADAGPPDEALAMLDLAMSGDQPTSERTVTPFGPETLTLVTPVGHDSQVSAALIMEFPTDSAQQRVLYGWGVVGLAAAVPAAALCAATWPIAGWVLRPLRRLASSIDRVRRGEMDVEVEIDSGPPELRGVAESFNEMSRTVVSTLERQQQFVADASHQLRNPLAALHVGLENLEAELEPGEEAQESYDEAMQTVLRMEALVDDLLQASSLPAAQQDPLSCRMQDLRETGWQALAASYGGRVDVVLDPATVAQPTGGLETLVEELLDNAFRLGRAESVLVRGVRQEEADTYRLTVDDDGRGLAQDELHLPGTRFWRSTQNQNLPGSGLGLSILKQGVADAGGALSVSSSARGGLLITVEVPLH
jgi:signal transduction histidine kinase